MMLAEHFVGRCQLAEARMRHNGYLIRHMHTSHASTCPLSPAARHDVRGFSQNAIAQ